jgi:hypothetical protein
LFQGDTKKFNRTIFRMVSLIVNILCTIGSNEESLECCSPKITSHCGNDIPKIQFVQARCASLVLCTTTHELSAENNVSALLTRVRSCGSKSVLALSRTVLDTHGVAIDHQLFTTAMARRSGPGILNMDEGRTITYT